MIASINGKTPSIHPTAFISKAAYVMGDVEIGENSSVWPGAVIRADFGRVIIGKNTSIQDNCVIHTDSILEIGDNVTVGHNATIHSKKLGNTCLVGISAILLHGAVIGNECIIAAGSIVAPKKIIPDRSLVMGSSSEIKGHVSDEEIKSLQFDHEAYTSMAMEYRKSEENL